MGKVLAITLVVFLSLSTVIYAHSGRTDASGGHNCSEKSISKGLCTGYHYHNGGSSSSGSSTQSNTTKSLDRNCSDFANYDEVVAYWNSKGYSATYDPENLDGWGKGVIDDGIPCEAPDSYDKIKINNSKEQNQFKQEQTETENGEKAGYAQGLKDGYQAAVSNSTSSSGSLAYKEGYSTGYIKGFEEGKVKIEKEKLQAYKEGEILGEKQDKLVVSEKYKNVVILKSSFEEGFNKVVNERIKAKKKEMDELGYKDGKNDMHSPPKDLEEIYITAYQEGYDRAQKELEENYTKQGYEAAFTMLEYKKPSIANAKFVDWYEEGFKSNEEIKKIRDAGYNLGENGEEYTVPAKYKKGEEIFEHYYKIGKEEYENQQKVLYGSISAGVGLIVLTWFGRRLYLKKKSTND